MTSEIEAKRKELREKAYLSRDRWDDGQFWGFNLGVSLAQKEFLYKIDELISKHKEVKEFHYFIEELKQSLGEKTK